ncbi:hypothetical protein ABZP36_008167 [Zizania latifolia]
MSNSCFFATHKSIDPTKYKSISSGFGVLLKEQGARGFFRGWVPKLLGYSAQGLEVVADVALCPMEAVKVRVQTRPGFARGLSDGLLKFAKAEGYAGLYKGIIPLWGRQIPFNVLANPALKMVVSPADLTKAKHFIIWRQICDDNLYAHTLASVASGLTATTLSCPVPSRCNQNQDDEPGQGCKSPIQEFL